MAVRAENASLKRKQQEVERALLERAKAERVKKIEADYQAISQPPDPPPAADARDEPPSPPERRRRKPARRVVVTEVSSASETEDEVEVVIPRARKPPTAEEVTYQRAVSKMFEYV